MESERQAVKLTSNRIAVVGTTQADRQLFTANGNRGSWVSFKRSASSGEPITVTCWALPTEQADRVAYMVERHNARLATEAQTRLVAQAERIAANAPRPRRSRHFLGWCADCQDGRCCGRCSCCED